MDVHVVRAEENEVFPVVAGGRDGHVDEGNVSRRGWSQIKWISGGCTGGRIHRAEVGRVDRLKNRGKVGFPSKHPPLCELDAEHMA
jgi:hypothetical protein